LDIGFTLKAMAEAAEVASATFTDGFNGDLTRQRRMTPAVNRTHPAAADEFPDDVITYLAFSHH
jgi:hypothetical protein